MKTIGEIKKMTTDKLLHESLIPKWGYTLSNDEKSDCDETHDEINCDDKLSMSKHKEIEQFSKDVRIIEEDDKPRDLKELMQSKDVPKITYFFEKPACDKPTNDFEYTNHSTVNLVNKTQDTLGSKFDVKRGEERKQAKPTQVCRKTVKNINT